VGAHRRANQALLDLASGQLEGLRQRCEVDVRGDRRLVRRYDLSDPLAQLLVGKRQLDIEQHAPLERLVDVLLEVGREHDDADVLFDLLEQELPPRCGGGAWISKAMLGSASSLALASSSAIFLSSPSIV
jgi:hypothetical protein